MNLSSNYVVIGNGHMAKHLCYYFDYLKINYQRWYRSGMPLSELNSLLVNATHVILLINDNAIENFINKYIIQKHPHLIRIHFSGSLVTELAYGAHPLQTFNNSHYSFEEYVTIPFIIDDTAPEFSILLPDVPNPHYRISASQKPYYHAMCVLANNVSTLLWQKFFREMQHRFAIKQEHLQPFLLRTMKNILSNPATALTGPFARKDFVTLDKDLHALQGDPFYSIFQSIIKQFIEGDSNENHT